MQGVGDFGDVYWSVVGHSFLLLGYVHDFLNRFLLIIGPDLQYKHTHTRDSDRSVTATDSTPL